jgi:hypothetical protein
MISYLDYIKRLDELEIKLYDFQKRISYFRLLNLKSEKNNQIGGKEKFNNIGSNELNNLSNNIIYKIDKFQLENIILNLLAKEYDKANLLCDHFCLKN